MTTNQVLYFQKVYNHDHKPFASFPQPLHQEVGSNYVWLKPLVQEFQRFVPGSLVLTDILLYADGLLDGRLFPQEPKQTHVSKEASRLKKLMGALRTLYRNSISN